MIRTAYRLVLAALLSWSATASAGPAPFWQRSWTISAILGQAAPAPDVKAVVGQRVVLSPDHVEAPLFAPCATAPDYRDIAARPRRQLPRHLGANWKFPAALGAKPVFGWIRCDGYNFGGVAFSDPSHGYLFFEDGLIFVLK